MTADINEIYREHGRYVFNIAYRMLSNRSDAEDVCHEVFIKLNSSLGSFKGYSSVKTYIYRMTVNQSIDYIRKQQSQAARVERSFDAMKTASVREDSLMLDDLLSLLDPQSRACVLLYEVAGFSQNEIAAIMQTQTGTVKSRISRSIRKMSEHLEKEGEENALKKGNALFLPEK
jgi:RNA polymerase sigma-70 factor (ECF subfamily)